MTLIGHYEYLLPMTTFNSECRGYKVLHESVSVSVALIAWGDELNTGIASQITALLYVATCHIYLFLNIICYLLVIIKIIILETLIILGCHLYILIGW